VWLVRAAGSTVRLRAPSPSLPPPALSSPPHSPPEPTTRDLHPRRSSPGVTVHPERRAMVLWRRVSVLLARIQLARGRLRRGAAETTVLLRCGNDSP
jgi:hypothetical protein